MRFLLLRTDSSSSFFRLLTGMAVLLFLQLVFSSPRPVSGFQSENWKAAHPENRTLLSQIGQDVWFQTEESHDGEALRKPGNARIPGGPDSRRNPQTCFPAERAGQNRPTILPRDSDELNPGLNPLLHFFLKYACPVRAGPTAFS